MSNQSTLFCSLLCGLCTTFVLHNASAQTAPIDDYFVAKQVASGSQKNITRKTKTIFSHLVHIEAASSFQIVFGRTSLPQGTLLRMTSLQDGATQHLNDTTLKQWQYKSAWFNGSMVLVELIAEPLSASAHLTIKGVTIIERLADDRSICDGVDDRVLSYENRDARAIPIGCTAWIIDDANHTMLTAGHCTAGGAIDIETIEFNVPLSDASGNIQHPSPEDQYATDPESLQSFYSEIGNDWAYFGCFPNSESGLTPFQAQEEYYVLSSSAPPVDGQQITITGFGVTSSPVPSEYNQAQKTHTGPYAVSSGTSIGYRTDTTGGNSGSAVLNDETGEAIGIHTNAGCGDGTGENWGCAIHNSGLQNALANPQGVCIPNILIYDFPAGLPFDVLPNITTTISFNLVGGVEEPIPDSIKVVLQVNGTQDILDAVPLGNNMYEVTLPTFNCEDSVSYYFTAQGDGGSTVNHPYSAPNAQYNIVVGTIDGTTILIENFSDGIPSGWSTSGLWTTTSSCMPAGVCDGGSAAYFGITSSCTYDNGSTATGALSTPAIPIDEYVGNFVLSFCSAVETENLNGYDLAELYANGNFIAQLNESSDWQQVEFKLTGITGDTLQIEWRFDSVDSLYNDYRGWHIDGIQLLAQEVSCDDISTCYADITGDNVVDVSDLLTVIDQWGQMNSPADITGDGEVNVSDLLEVVGTWGPCV